MKEFEEWYEINYAGEAYLTFDNLPFSMQWGVYLEFFDSKGIVISIDGSTGAYCGLIQNRNIASSSTGFKDTRTEAQKAAIEKAFEILENR